MVVQVTFVSGEVIEASDLNNNFADIESFLENLGNDQLSRDAGITSDKLADRYATNFADMLLVPPTANTALDPASDDSFTTPLGLTGATASVIGRIYPEARANRRNYLVAASVYSLEIGQGGGTGYPALYLYHNGTLLTGAGVTLNAVGPWYMRNASPHSAPIVPFQLGDYFEWRLGRTVADGPPTIRGLHALMTFKNELGA